MATVYECPPWCIYKDAPLSKYEHEGVNFGPEHEEYYGNIKGSDDVVLSNAPEHVGPRVVLLDHDNQRQHEAVKMDVELRWLAADGEQPEVYISISDGGGCNLDPVSGALEFAADLEKAALRLRRVVAGHAEHFTEATPS